jgi:hypothetical protein
VDDELRSRSFLSNTAEEHVEALDIISIASNSATSAVDYAKFRSRSHDDFYEQIACCRQRVDATRINS